MANLSDITLISVAYNSADAMAGLLASVPSDVPVIIVDNGSEDLEALKKTSKTYANAKLIEAGENVGFGRANNLGAQHANTEFLLIQNPDTQLTADTLEHLLAAAQAHPKASAFNPKFVDETGHMRYKRKNVLLPRSRKMPRGMPDHPFEVCVLVGASILVRRAAFEAVGGFDPNIFLYFEDDDLSVRLEVACGPLMIVPDAVVTHARGGSSKGDEQMSPFKYWHFGHSRVYTTQKHARPFARAKSLLVALDKFLTPKAWGNARDMKGRLWHLRGTWAALMDRPATKDTGR